MSSPPQHPLNNDIQPVEDCRDYLRTGRCKYGGSCKYNHPPNVQNGGGMKIPLNPSEPLFPIRPGEPVCQYYMKHGTCKFGQACKFHHPAQGAGQVMNNGQVVMNVLRQSDISTSQLFINPVLGDPNGHGVMLQLLPQRPDEPDCIYFLKNGRCKYGATCRYHHPVALSQSQQRIEKTTSRRQPMATIDQQKGQKVHYVTQVLHSYPQGQFILTDNTSPVTFINVDGFNQQGYQVISAIDGVPQYCFPATTTTAVMTEQSSSGSSIASFETANEHMGEAAAAHWNRAKRNGSASNLSNGMIENRSQTRLYIPHVASEGNIIQPNRRSRAASYGSANDNSTYFDQGTGSLPRTVSASSWRSADRGSGPYDNVQRVQPQQFTVLPDGKVVDLRLRGRPPPVMANTQRRVEPLRRRSTRTGEHDEGFTMMTSALLNMLDTPEETSGENYSEDEFIQSHDDYQRFDNRLVGSSSYGHFSNEQIPPGFDLSSSPPQSTHATLNKSTSQQLDPTMFQRLSLRPGSFNDDQNGTSETTSSWSPTWQGALSGHVSEDSLKSMRGVLNASHVHTSTPGSAHDSDVGLYLP